MPSENLNLSYYFQPMDRVDVNQLQLTDVSLYSMTPWKEANFVSRTILNFYKKNGESHPLKNEAEHGGSLTIPYLRPKYGDIPIITDATSHVGGNTLSFHLSGFKTVHSVEIDPQICQMLIHNLQTYHLPTEHVHYGDYVAICRDLRQDVVFLDPPWGGPDYINNPCLDLYLGTTNIVEVCADLMSQHRASLIVLKVPINYNFSCLLNKLNTQNFLTHKVYRGTHHSYNIIFCWSCD
uniref:Trimethylguanosine synthase n=1 Tax=viral metagenome TaxID=1070528 RepID=A0A6C0BIR1_9ZZZZ